MLLAKRNNRDTRFRCASAIYPLPLRQSKSKSKNAPVSLANQNVECSEEPKVWHLHTSRENSPVMTSQPTDLTKKIPTQTFPILQLRYSNFSIHTFLYKSQWTVYMRNCKLGSGVRVTLGAGTTFLHIDTLARLPGATRDTQSMRKPCFAPKPVNRIMLPLNLWVQTSVPGRSSFDLPCWTL